MSGQLTKYKLGSIGEVFTISYPLFLTSFSISLMLYVNRMLLARYSIDAMNSIVAVSVIIAAFQVGFSAITSIAEVFAGRFNGSRSYKLIGTPVWQMIWFALGSSAIFIFIGLVTTNYFIPKEFREYGSIYFKITMSAGFLMPLISAIASYYVGLGRVLLVTVSAIVANIVNLIISLLIINGYEDIIPAMGVVGASISYIISQIIQFLILFCIFIRKKEDETYGTRRWRYDKDIMKNCIKLGFPVCLGRIIEILGWALIFVMLSKKNNNDYLTVYTIGNSIFLVLLAFTDAIQKSVLAISANFIGSLNFEYISKLLKSSIILLSIITILLIIIMYFIHDFIIIELIGVNNINDYLLDQSILTLKGVIIYFYIETIFWILVSILISGGDTKFILIANVFCAWFFCTIPTYIILNYFNSQPSTLWIYLFPAYIIINLAIIIYRYKSNKWLRVHL